MQSTRNPISNNMLPFNSLFSNATRSLAPTIKECFDLNITPDFSRNQLLTDYCSNQLLAEYSSVLSRNLNIDSQTVYDQLKKERDLFIAVTKLTNYSTIALSKNEDWVYNSGPIRLATGLAHERVLFIHEDLDSNHISEASLDSLILEAEQMKSDHHDDRVVNEGNTMRKRG